MVSRIRYNRRAQRAFTLIEILVVVSIMGILIASVAELTGVFEAQNDIRISATTYAQAVRRAQILSQGMSKDSGWGVLIATSSVTLYEGSTYATRNTAFDEQYPFSTPLAIVGLSEIDFTKFTGLPSAYGTTTISAAGAASAKSVVVTSHGSVQY